MKYLITRCIIIASLVYCSHRSNELGELREKNNKTYSRDSSFIIYTVNVFLAREYFVFSGYTTNKTKDKLTVYVDDIYYSDDSLKIMSNIIIKVPNNEFAKANNKKQNYYFDGQTVVGYRENTLLPWTIYPLDIYRPSRWDRYKQVKNLQRHFYFYEIKNATEYVVDSIKGYRMEQYGYTVNEPKFWTSSLLWKKGTRLQGFYIFETNGPVTNPGILPYLKINYPDSLIRLFRR